MQVPNEFAAEELFLHCEKRYGKVRSLRFHKNSEDETFSAFYLVVFDSPEGVKAAVEGGVMPSASNRVATASASMPIRSPFMWFNSSKGSRLSTAIPIYIPVHGCESDNAKKGENATVCTMWCKWAKQEGNSLSDLR